MKKHIYISCILLSTTLVYGQQYNKLDKEKSKAIESLIANLYEYQTFSGMAIAITKDNQIVYSNAYGVKNILTQSPIKEGTIFHFASVSKTFVSSAILKLYSDNKLKLTDPISKYINNTTIPDSIFKTITIQHLLNHTSGISGIDDHHWDNPKFSNKALKNYVTTRSIKITMKPGDNFRYTDIGYELLGYVIEKASGMSFEQYIKKTFLVPLQMEHTTFIKSDFDDSLYAQPHVYDYDACKIRLSTIYPYNREHAPSSTLQSTVLDFCNYGIFHLNNGTFDKKPILDKEVYKVLWDTAVVVNWSDEYKYYGAGWFIGKSNGQKIIHHSGNDNGFRSDFILLPESNISITIVSNYYQTRVLDLGSQIAKILTQHTYDNEKLSDSLEEFIGEYCNDSNCVTIYQEKNRLFLNSKEQTDCLIPAPYKGIFIGKYLEGNKVKPYYDCSNIWLQKTKLADETISFELRVGGNKYIKKSIR
jgi:CubicO group peptidase (beta-lactamase class C family)